MESKGYKTGDSLMLETEWCPWVRAPSIDCGESYKHSTSGCKNVLISFILGDPQNNCRKDQDTMQVLILRYELSLQSFPQWPRSHPDKIRMATGQIAGVDKDGRVSSVHVSFCQKDRPTALSQPLSP